MKRSTRFRVVTAMLAGIGLLTAACSSGSSSEGTTTATPAAATTSAATIGHVIRGTDVRRHVRVRALVRVPNRVQCRDRRTAGHPDVLGYLRQRW